MDRLRGKVALVLGVGPNIGGTIASVFAKEGAQLVIADVNQETIARAEDALARQGHRVHGLVCDATKEDSVRALFQGVDDIYGGIDIVVNVVGKPYWGSILELELRDWITSMHGAPTAGMLITKYAATRMIAGGRSGSITHILSTAAHFGEAGASAYTAAKAALLSVARSSAMDLAHYGVRVNTVTPCSMEHQLWTNMRDEVFDPHFERPNRPSFYSRAEYLEMIPMERFPRSEDIAWAAVFLASDEAACITGVDLPVDGGLRIKYPTWIPGRHWGVSIAEYVSKVRRYEYGVEIGPLVNDDEY